MTRSPPTCLGIVVVGALAAAFPKLATAQDATRSISASIAPAVLRADGEDITPALRFDLALDRRRHVVATEFPRSPYFRAHSRGTLALDAPRNPEQLRASVASGIAIDLAVPATIAFDPEAVDAPADAMRFDYGTLAIGAQLDIRSDQRAREVFGGLQGELLYFHDHQSSLWPVVPAVFVAAGARRPLRSEVRDSLGARHRAEAQLDATAVWHLSLDRSWTPVFLHSFRLHGELRGFMTFDADERIEAVGADRGSYFAGTVAYQFRRPTLRLVEVFIRWSDGELQTRTADRRAWMLGLVIGSIPARTTAPASE